MWFRCRFIVLTLPFLNRSFFIHFFQMISFPKIFQIAWSAMSRWWGGIKSLVILAITPSQPSFCKYSGNVTKNICSQYKKDFFHNIRNICSHRSHLTTITFFLQIFRKCYWNICLNISLIHVYFDFMTSRTNSNFYQFCLYKN